MGNNVCAPLKLQPQTYTNLDARAKRFNVAQSLFWFNLYFKNVTLAVEVGMAEWSKALHLLHNFFCEADPWVKSSNPNEAIKTTFFSHFLCLVNKERTIENIKFHKQRRTSKQKKNENLFFENSTWCFWLQKCYPLFVKIFLFTYVYFICHDNAWQVYMFACI